jgi:adenosyl cobinamide kinase/adenosyl cobinamide phosphate guanylyltransferase
LSIASDRDEPVTFVATAEGRDDDMRGRIEAHRRERPEAWMTVEAPVEIEGALAAADPTETVVIDCLTLWVANLLERDVDRDTILAASVRAATIASNRPGLTVAISNEVGLGVVPATPLGRRYRDLLGEVNRSWVGAADESWFVVAGRRLRLE